MTGAELVATALTTGAAAALTGPARGTVHDLHDALRQAVRRRLTSPDTTAGPYAVRVLDAHASDPDVWGTRLLRVLDACGADEDAEILRTARALLRAERIPAGPAADAY
ncbi:hypothetical protein OOK44_18420 [Streptomyces cellulosae]|uniref:Uncharacterized protein n=2 Tax=Streptomyces TaxID=1883 RepID=A0ABU3JBB2_9ACTN|nr:hypothetical protein [Streptomyces cellulosae]MDQ0490775.1 hypothetical protein [Streptomyces thermodiastaticus]MDT6972350.1 hypothetical protein [Streptomyces thermocarboxydus]MXQ62108.1 hypothetical protein [Streptomyces sp. XHT-2]MYQ33550.1 hypothetical protein [Streptomyces sp. SID4956]MYW51879.1 hypothetical protein [Streptomyces sp. SID8376]